jgi:hypothetical protein
MNLMQMDTSVQSSHDKFSTQLHLQNGLQFWNGANLVPNQNMS